MRAGARFSLNRRVRKVIQKSSQNTPQNLVKIVKNGIPNVTLTNYQKHIEKSVPKCSQRVPRCSQNGLKMRPKVVPKSTLAPKGPPAGPKDTKILQNGGPGAPKNSPKFTQVPTKAPNPPPNPKFHLKVKEKPNMLVRM